MDILKATATASFTDPETGVPWSVVEGRSYPVGVKGGLSAACAYLSCFQASTEKPVKQPKVEKTEPVKQPKVEKTEI